MIWSRSGDFTEGEIQIPRYCNGRAEPKNLEKNSLILAPLEVDYKRKTYVKPTLTKNIKRDEETTMVYLSPGDCREADTSGQGGLPGDPKPGEQVAGDHLVPRSAGLCPGRCAGRWRWARGAAR